MAHLGTPKAMVLPLLLCAPLFAAACGGKSSGSSTSSARGSAASVSSTSKAQPPTSPESGTSGSQSSADPRMRLAASAARRVASICRHDETGEDQNVIDQFADKGFSIMAGPPVVAALGTAARDVAHESVQVRATARSPATVRLSGALTSEAQALKAASTFRHARADEQLLLTALQRRRTIAAAAGVKTNCAGAASNSLRPSAPSS
jgi:hypothetical protein